MMPIPLSDDSKNSRTNVKKESPLFHPPTTPTPSKNVSSSWKTHSADGWFKNKCRAARFSSPQKPDTSPLTTTSHTGQKIRIPTDRVQSQARGLQQEKRYRRPGPSPWMGSWSIPYHPSKGGSWSKTLTVWPQRPVSKSRLGMTDVPPLAEIWVIWLEMKRTGLIFRFPSC